MNIVIKIMILIRIILLLVILIIFSDKKLIKWNTMLQNKKINAIAIMLAILSLQ